MKKILTLITEYLWATVVVHSDVDRIVDQYYRYHHHSDQKLNACKHTEAYLNKIHK